MMNDIEASRKNKYFLNYLRGWAIMLVVIHHSMSYGMDFFEYSYSFDIIRIIISYIHVPLFIMISGYLCHTQIVAEFYKKKIFRILIPFLFFSLLKFLANGLQTRFNFGSSFGSEFLRAFINGEYYWFCYAIFLMYLIAPLIWKLKTKIIFVITILLVLINSLDSYIGIYPDINCFQFFNSLRYIPWFFAGMLLQRGNVIKDKNGINAVLPAVLSALILSCCIVLRVLNIFSGYCCKMLISLSSSYILLVFARILPEGIKPFDAISRYSYQIFLTDSFVKVILFLILSKFFDINIVVVFIIATLNILCSSCCAHICSKIKPLKLLVGL